LKFLIHPKIKIALAILFFTSFQFYGQEIYLKANKLDSLYHHFDNTTALQIDRLNHTHFRQKEKILKKRLTLIKKQLKDSIFLFSSDLNLQLKKILNVIYSSNPALKQYHFSFFIHRSLIPNAAAYGDGNFIINLGLFDFVASDDELAFIICHEIAHYINEDINKQIDQYIEKINSKEINSKIRAIKNKKYGKNKAGMEFFKELGFDMFRYSREKEINADLLGYQFYKKTPYSENAAISILNKLGRLEEIVFNKPIHLNDFFNFKEYPFDNHWITKKSSLFDSDEIIDDYEINKDSLRSHPNVDKRIKSLHSKYNIDTVSVIQAKGAINPLKKIAKKVTFKNLEDTKSYDLLLYYSLKNIQENTASDMDYSRVLHILNEVYISKKEHTIGELIFRPSPFSNEKYLNQIRLFFHKTELKDLKSIGYYFTLYNKDKLKDNTFNTFINIFKP